jgi:hypothetical protein
MNFTAIFGASLWSGYASRRATQKMAAHHGNRQRLHLSRAETCPDDAGHLCLSICGMIIAGCRLIDLARVVSLGIPKPHMTGIVSKEPTPPSKSGGALLPVAEIRSSLIETEEPEPRGEPANKSTVDSKAIRSSSQQIERTPLSSQEGRAEDMLRDNTEKEEWSLNWNAVGRDFAQPEQPAEVPNLSRTNRH